MGFNLAVWDNHVANNQHSFHPVSTMSLYHCAWNPLYVYTKVLCSLSWFDRATAPLLKLLFTIFFYFYQHSFQVVSTMSFYHCFLEMEQVPFSCYGFSWSRTSLDMDGTLNFDHHSGSSTSEIAAHL